MPDPAQQKSDTKSGAAELQQKPLGTPLRAQQEERISAPNPNHPPPWWALLLLGVAIALLASWIWYWMRRAALRTWAAFATQIGGEFKARNDISPAVVIGKIRERPFLMETATSHEDEAGYYHTRGSVPIRNAGSFILGLRRKSLLEEAQTRGEKTSYHLDDPDFEGRFFIVCNDWDHLESILTPEVRRELRRYHDIEIYVRLGEMEWRRSGEQSDIAIIRRLNETLLDMAEAIDRLPSRGRSLTQCLADEKMIEKGV